MRAAGCFLHDSLCAPLCPASYHLKPSTVSAVVFNPPAPAVILRAGRGFLRSPSPVLTRPPIPRGFILLPLPQDSSDGRSGSPSSWIIDREDASPPCESRVRVALRPSCRLLFYRLSVEGGRGGQKKRAKRNAKMQSGGFLISTRASLPSACDPLKALSALSAPRWLPHQQPLSPHCQGRA